MTDREKKQLAIMSDQSNSCLFYGYTLSTNFFGGKVKVEIGMF